MKSTTRQKKKTKDKDAKDKDGRVHVASGQACRIYLASQGEHHIMPTQRLFSLLRTFEGTD